MVRRLMFRLFVMTFSGVLSYAALVDCHVSTGVLYWSPNWPALVLFGFMFLQSSGWIVRWAVEAVRCRRLRSQDVGNLAGELADSKIGAVHLN